MKEPRPYQLDAENAYFDYYAEGGEGNALIAMPTGTGKALVISRIIKRLYEQGARKIVNLTHVSTLIEQNHADLIEEWPEAPAGIFSAGLGRKEHYYPITYGGVQSVRNNPEKFGAVDVCLVDECHLISPKAETSYQKVFRAWKEINPYFKVGGLSATCYRLGQGWLTEDGIFDEVVFNNTGVEAFNQLIEDGYLVPPVPKRTETTIDVSDVKVQGGEFQEADLDAHTNTPDLNWAICHEMVAQANDLPGEKMVFCTSIDHAENITAILRSLIGDSQVEVVHSKIDKDINKRNIARWKNADYPWIVNKDMLTTGVNNPRVMYIGILRATNSASLWVQILGRGTRPYPGKDYCLVGDFAGNAKRLGPINDPLIPQRPGKGKKTAGVVPIKMCPEGHYNHTSARFCSVCQYEFPKLSQLTDESSELELVRREVEPVYMDYDVHHVVYSWHQKGDQPPCMRMTYHCGRLALSKFDEWVMPEHKGYPRKNYLKWWNLRSKLVPVDTTEQLLEIAPKLPVPKQIKVITNRSYPTIEEISF